MYKFFKMGLKPLEHPPSQNPFTKVNGNKKKLFFFFIAVSFLPVRQAGS